MALRAVPDHPKFADLRQRLKLNRYEALGLLEALWHFAGRFTPQGNVGKYPDSTIAAWIEWSGDPVTLIDSLVSARWLDRDPVHRLLIHDWATHADKATKQALSRSKLEFCVPTVHTERTQNSVLSALPVPVPVPVPVPEPEPEPVAVSRNGVRRPSQRFDEWWQLWSSVRGTAHRSHAERAWFNVATVELEKAIMDCTQSYLDSLDSPGKGYNPHNFLVQMAQDGFTGHFISRKRPPKDEPDDRYTPMK